MVKDIFPGSAFGLNQPNNTVGLNGLAFFKANDGTNGTEIWKSEICKNINFRKTFITPCLLEDRFANVH